MAVYTEVSPAQLEDLLSRYTLGELESFSGISAGIENTNYSLRTSAGRFILTVFETTEAQELPFCLDLMAYLRDHGVASARPQADSSGALLHMLDSKPAVIVEHLLGRSVDDASLVQCQAVGEALAGLHLLTRDYPSHKTNVRGTRWHHDAALRVAATLSEADRALLSTSLAAQARYAKRRLPLGVIHADLFRDNVLFTDDRISGLIDFYYAHTGPLIYDLAVTVSDWCIHSDGRFEIEKAHALVSAYRAIREVRPMEIESWQESLTAVGLRFFLSRTLDHLFPRDGLITRTKDPERFRNLLWQCEHAAEGFSAVWER